VLSAHPSLLHILLQYPSLRVCQCSFHSLQKVNQTHTLLLP
jgi:hypothetical protein